RFSRDWSSDVCSSDLYPNRARRFTGSGMGASLGERERGTNLGCVKKLASVAVVAVLSLTACGAASSATSAPGVLAADAWVRTTRSEERRVGKEWSARR